MDTKKYFPILISLVIVIIIGTILFHYVENWRWLDSLYFCVTTLTTVGYGDFTPQTDAGKIIFIFYILSGLGILFAFVNAFSKKIIEYRMGLLKKIEKKRK
ncbi:MAG: two pore domain potassium channel family protein [Candidatus Cloacimonetes bacterium]|nr:two pore domain potassium channel family protein [Candidatus Cloacimonadota bacterium]